MTVKVKPKTVFVDYEEYEGNTLKILLNYKNPDGTQINLAGFFAEMEVKSSLTSPHLIRITSADEIALGGSDYNIKAKISQTQTKTTLGIGDFIYDMRLTDAEGDTFTFISGRIKIKQGVTGND